MCKLDQLQISEDRRAVLVDGTWVELRGAIENIFFIKPECEACPKETHLSCIQLNDVDRRANCEMLGEVKLFEDMSTNPMPQVGELYQKYLEKNAPKHEVVPEPFTPEPPKRATLADKVRGVFKF